MPRGLDVLLLAADFLDVFQPPVLRGIRSISNSVSLLPSRPSNYEEINALGFQGVSENNNHEAVDKGYRIIRRLFIPDPALRFDVMGERANHTISHLRQGQISAESSISTRPTTHALGTKRKRNDSNSGPINQDLQGEEKESFPSASTATTAPKRKRKKVYEPRIRMLRSESRKSLVPALDPRTAETPSPTDEVPQSQPPEGAVPNGVEPVPPAAGEGREKVARGRLNIPEANPSAQQGIPRPLAMSPNEVIAIVNKFKGAERWSVIRRPK